MLITRLIKLLSGSLRSKFNKSEEMKYLRTAFILHRDAPETEETSRIQGKEAHREKRQK